MSDWGIALLVIALVAVAAVVLGILFRIFGIYQITSCFATSEEKAVLTKNEQYNGYMINSGSDFTLDRPGKYVEYDTLNTDPAYAGQESHSPPRQESSISSPVSMETGSIASDLDFGQGIRRAESCDSVASDSSVLEMQPDMPKIGQLEFALEYDRIHIVSVSQNVKNSTDPVFKERFLFTMDQEELENRTLQLQMFSLDKYQRHKVIGEGEIRLGDIDMKLPIKMWLNLRDIDEKPTEYGDILFSLSYLPTAERLTIVIVKARNLKWSESKDAGDPFVKVYLMQNAKNVSKKKTTVKRGERNPIFNEAMIFSVPATALPTVQLRITVAELLPDNRTPSLGHVIVGANTSGTELSHWNQMMTSLRKPVAMWHYLRK
ncbi:hypothetical protein ACJMK2_028341 [Sinanodonta woodiana]|uniref:C2 domain-containing protein n=1 Tax=Sinanodonta woodiana TaxID=1069815 RepID=A0ABD3X6T1_SINWO